MTIVYLSRDELGEGLTILLISVNEKTVSSLARVSSWNLTIRQVPITSITG